MPFRKQRYYRATDLRQSFHSFEAPAPEGVDMQSSGGAAQGAANHFSQMPQVKKRLA